ncbi:MAG: hypothetical protein INQ03_11785 [Candidatus Heimdallarchaeota archaeon]|nr:hypothetical protein [Candidatus Heimdallarchaeota archaeon]
MVDPFTFMAILLAVVAQIIATLMVLRVYYKEKFQDYLVISLGLFFSMLLPLSYFIFFFLEGEQYVTFRNIAAKLAVILAGIGGIIIYHAQLRISSSKRGLYHDIFLAFAGISFGVYYFRVWWTWNTSINSWTSHNDTIGVLLIGITALLYNGLNLNMSRKNYHCYLRSQGKGAVLAHQLIMLGWLVSILGLIEIILERIILPEEEWTIIWVTITAIGILMVGIGLSLHPYGLLRRNIKSKYLIINETSSGLPIFEYHFLQNESTNTTLVAGAMGAILIILKEITEQSDVPPEIAYVNLRISIVQKRSYTAFLISERTNNAVRVKLTKIVDLLDHLKEDEIVELIETKMEFLF